jgi:poly-gamma-glutamate synthesis protein (capsule biosynthesis protein)
MRPKILFVFLMFSIITSACQSSTASTQELVLSSTPTQTSTSKLSADTQIPPTQTREPSKNTLTPTLTPTQLPSPTPDTPEPQTEKRVHLMAVGDIMLGRTIGELILNESFRAPFLFTAETLQSADITIGNLECPISGRGVPVEKKYVFRAPIDAAKSLAYAGFDLVTIANNHILDYGPIALADTLVALSGNGILSVGAGVDFQHAYAPVIIEKNNLKIAFLAFVDVPTGDYNYQAWEAAEKQPGVAWAYHDHIRDSVQDAKRNADLVIVLVRNGYEFVQRVSELQKEVAYLAIDSGASLVIGSHPHVLQRIEPYHDGLIVYSMGNFVFDNFLFPPNYSAILSVVLTPEGVESYELIDVVVQLNGVPQIMPYHFDD